MQISTLHLGKSFGIKLADQRPGIPIRWIKKAESSLLVQHFKEPVFKPQKSAFSTEIERLAQATNRLGPQPLWVGYGDHNIAGPTRLPNTVRTAAIIGDLYTSLVQQRKPEIIVEFGTAFGVSGMYFLAGLNINEKGKLLTFEPNVIWAELAINNLSQISKCYELMIGTFEENIDKVLPEGQSIDLAFIDAIHTREFVIPQLNAVVEKCNPRALIILDDIGFSPDMRACWEEVSVDSRFAASATFGSRVGIVELNC